MSKNSRPTLVGLIVAVFVVVVGAAVYAWQTGAIVPNGAAARYVGNSYIYEDEITDYIASYRVSQGLQNSDDSAWAEHLASANLTPQSLRYATIKQFVIDAMVDRRAAEEGISVSQEELDEYVDSVKGNLAFGDDDMFAKTLEAHGQTVEQATESYRSLMLQDKLFEKVVEKPKAKNDQVLSYLKRTYPNGVTTKHIYYFTINGLDEEGSYAKFEAVQKVRKQFYEGAHTADAFAALVQSFSNDAELVSRGGADGWDLDVADRSEGYKKAVSELEIDGVSQVFADPQGYSFVWVDSAYTLPKPSEDSFSLKDVPKTLRSYFSDSASYVLWQQDCQKYLEQLFAESETVVYAMPSDVPYNVDMSLADTGSK